MGIYRILWAFSLPLATFPALAADPPPNVTYPDIPRTYVPEGARTSPAVQSRAQQTAPATAPTGPTNVGAIPTPDSIPAPTSVVPTAPSAGRYRNAKGEVNISKMFLDRYKQSVVRVTARDMAGNELSRAMGVGVGRNAQYIATPLSIVLGNSQQWADRIEITHAAGNKYFAKIALIDEEKNLVLLAPETNPTPLPYAREQDERPNVDVFTFSFADGPEGIDPSIHRGLVAAVNAENGLLSISSTTLNDDQSGSAIINTQGELLGMLLPAGRGVLSSTLQKLAMKAQRASPFEPNLIGTILGRGVLVAAKTEGAFPTIAAALEAIRKGEAPKADPTRFTAAKDRAVAPKKSDKIVIKVMPGTYREGKTISLPANISLSGSGADRTSLVGHDPEKPVLLLQNIENAMVSGFRIVPASEQKMKAPTVILSKANSVTLLGNVIEAKDGVGVWIHQSRGAKVFGNTFARGQIRGLSCDRSDLTLDGNAFVGDWPTAVSIDRGCSVDAVRNLFFENKNAITISSQARRAILEKNSFIRSPAAIKLAGSLSAFRLSENLFFECAYGLLAGGTVENRQVGRNVIWKTKIQARGRPVNSQDLVRSEPKFEAPESYDFRLKAGQSQLGTGNTEGGGDMGAFQRADYLGEYTQQLVRTLSAAVGEPDLATLWGLAP